MFDSPKKYILTRARSLPLHQCYITKGWRESGNATVVVARRHTNGHFTIGTYLVDLYCLGVKDTGYYFNVEKEQLDEILETSQSFGVAMIPCDYAEAHNIIYGAIEFAEEYGFKPHKDFAVTKFILEEDDERVEVIEYEFGMDGKPCVMVDAEHPQKAVIAQLEKTAGKGNFTVIYMDDLADDDDFDEFDESDEEEEQEENPFLNWTEQDWQDLAKGKKKVPEEHLPVLIDTLYRIVTAKENMPDNLELAQEFLDKFDITEEPLSIGYEPGDEEKHDMQEIISEIENMRKDSSRHIAICTELVRKYPNNLFFYHLLTSAYFYSGNRQAGIETNRAMMRRFPDSFIAKLHCCMLNIEMKNFDAIKAVLDNAVDMEHLPEKKRFTVVEMMLYCAVLSQYHLLHKDNLQTADVYYQAAKMLQWDYEMEMFDDFIEYTFMMVVMKKAEYMKSREASHVGNMGSAI